MISTAKNKINAINTTFDEQVKEVNQIVDHFKTTCDIPQEEYDIVDEIPYFEKKELHQLKEFCLLKIKAIDTMSIKKDGVGKLSTC
jgi:hypothetical protein